jgi:lipopolysaccharide heptosyltransferase III
MKLAVVCASGIGDALIFQTVSVAAAMQGREVATYSNHLSSFGRWLPPGLDWRAQPTVENIEEELGSFDAIFLQHDNSPKAFAIKKLKIPVYSFYGAHHLLKHGLFDKTQDYVCDRNLTMVENVRIAARQFFGLAAVTMGLVPPFGLVHRRWPRRIAIHPTASAVDKMWPKEKFLWVASQLKKDGYEPVFTVPAGLQAEWGGPLLQTLEDLASFIYESGAFLGNDSGPGHLASLLKIPHLIIAGNGLQMPLWRTGWLAGAAICPPKWLMKFKPLRKRWPFFVSKKNVIKNFKKNTLNELTVIKS